MYLLAAVEARAATQRPADEAFDLHLVLPVLVYLVKVVEVLVGNLIVISVLLAEASRMEQR